MEQEDAPANKAAAGLRMHLCDTLNGDIQNVVEMVLERGDALFKGRLDWLEHLWVKVKGLSPTTDLISVCWKGHVDGTAAICHRKDLTKAATGFTLARFAPWGGRLEAWMNHPEVLEGMAREEVSRRCTTRQLVALKNLAGIKRGTVNSRKADLLDYLDEFVGGFKRQSVEGTNPSVVEPGALEGGGPGCDFSDLGASDASRGRGDLPSFSGGGLTGMGADAEGGVVDDSFLTRPIARDLSISSGLEGPSVSTECGLSAVAEESIEAGLGL